LRAAAFDVGLATAGALLGDIAFSKDGNRLFAVQTNPGGLAYVDTSLDSRGLTRDYEAGLVELCAQPTAMTLFSDEANEYAAISCYKPAELFIVDLSGVRVVANIVLGTGPHAITLDQARQYLYVANSLDKTISLVDISRLRPTRFSEIARIGLQVPYRN
jgi:DNA-binding beta-propeller fold protein YncE